MLEIRRFFCIFAIGNEKGNEHIILNHSVDNDTLRNNGDIGREVFVYGENIAGIADRKRLLSR